MPTIAQVLAAPDGAYPASLVKEAKTLADNKAAYAASAASSASQLFLTQDELGLTAEDVVKAVTLIASEKQIINDNSEAAFAIMAKNTVQVAVAVGGANDNGPTTPSTPTPPPPAS